MSHRFHIGIVGGGFVGSAVSFGFGTSNGYDFNVKVYDIDPDKTTHSLEDVSQNSDFIFLCVPTPANEDYTINLNYIEEAVESIIPYIDQQIIIIKSTVIPGTCKRLSEQYGINIVSNPEFLTERRAKLDFLNPAQIIIGSDNEDVGLKVKDLYTKRFSSAKYLLTDTISAEIIKYSLNAFFAVKITYMNELYEIVERYGANWSDVIEGFIGDSRVADCHVSVPGPDGQVGFGGKCLPKDLNAIISFAQNLGVEPQIMQAAWSKNLDIRL